MLDMRDSGSSLARYRYGVMCLSKSHVMFIHPLPKDNEEGAGRKVVTDKDEKKKISEDLKRLVEFYMPQLAEYVPQKFTMDLTGTVRK